MIAPTSLLLGWSWSNDGWIVLAGALSAVSAALLGNFLVLRRMSMLGDAISHAVLPGLAAAYLLTGQRSSVAMFVGAVAVGVLTAVFTEWVSRFGEVDEGASLGVVFTTLFALGLVMIVRAADHVDLDPSCVLYGAIELVPLDLWDFGGWRAPRVVVVLAIVAAVNTTFVLTFFKELRIASFDGALADTMGYPSWLMHYALMTLVAVTAVASFEAVGNILVVAMLVAPPATARMLTDRLSVMVWLSVGIAVTAALLGHGAAVGVPPLLGFRSTTSASGMAVAAGGLFLAALLLAPRHGVVSRALRRLRLSLEILREDVLGTLYRARERSPSEPVSYGRLQDRVDARGWRLEWVVRELARRGLVERRAETLTLTAAGTDLARRLVRSHRLWEQYLVEQAGVSADRLHDKAELLEHVTDRAMRDALDQNTSSTSTDPHGQEIPDETVH